MKIDNFVNDISNNPKKAIVYAILLVILVIVIYFSYSKIKNLISNIYNNIKNRTDNPVTYNNLTYQDSWYPQNANVVFNAMNKWGTDSTAIETVFAKLRNQDDYNQLSRAYGTRTITVGIDSPAGTMYEHLVSELDNDELAEIQNGLSSYGITMS